MKGKNALGIALTVASIFGVAVTMYFCVKEAPEANDALNEEIERRKAESSEDEDTEEPDISIIDKAKTMAPHLKKTLIAGGITVVTIASGHIVHVLIAGSLAASAGVWKDKFMDLDKMVKKQNPELHRKVHEAVSKENIEKQLKKGTPKKPDIKDRNKVSSKIKNKADELNKLGEDNDVFMVYEEWTDQLFWTTKARLLEAKLALNERYISGDFVGINDLIKILGGVPNSDFNKIGWSIQNEMQMETMDFCGLTPWISIRVKAENGVAGVENQEVLVLYFENPPMEFEEALYFQ